MIEVINKYETIMVINPTLEEEKIEAIVEKFKALISANGEVTNVDVWGKRKLAYEINDLTEGYYVLVEFSAKPEFPGELERVYKITDSVMKFITIRKDEE